MKTMRTQALTAAAALIAVLALVTTTAQAADPVAALGTGTLPTWKDGGAKKSVAEFVAKVTKEAALILSHPPSV